MTRLISIAFCLTFCTISFAQSLERYSCIVDRIDIDKYMSARKFDQHGLVKTTKGYHPLSIAQYGILSYYEFEKTGDSLYFNQCVDQFQYFLDTSKVDELFEGKGLGLPYRFKFWDLQSPWYSGMTQGTALSYLIRYYQLTKDNRVPELLKKVCYVLMQPQEDGGAISKLESGCTFIEEYPKSKRSPAVLNGFFNGLIGLKEYCDFFPDDTTAFSLYEEVLSCCLQTLPLYDHKNWSHYNLKNRKIGSNYLRYQVYEVRQLDNMIQEPLLEYQRRIWCTMLENRPVKRYGKALKFKNHAMSLTAKEYYSGYLRAEVNTKLRNTKAFDYQVFNNSKSFKKYCKGRDYVKKNEKPSSEIFLEISADSNSIYDYGELFVLSEFKVLKAELIKQDHGRITLQNNKDYEVVVDSSKNVIYFSKPLDIDKIWIRIQVNVEEELLIDSIRSFNSTKVKPPFYCHKKSGIEEFEEGTVYDLSVKGFYTDSTVIYYKNHTMQSQLNNESWKITKVTNRIFTVPESGFYQFMAVFDYKSPITRIKDFDFIPMDK